MEEQPGSAAGLRDLKEHPDYVQQDEEPGAGLQSSRQNPARRSLQTQQEEERVKPERKDLAGSHKTLGFCSLCWGTTGHRLQHPRQMWSFSLSQTRCVTLRHLEDTWWKYCTY